MTRVNYTKYIILGMLGSGPMSGYEIRKYVKELFSYMWDIGYGQIYPMLSRLEREGMATMEEAPSGRGPNRKVYGITEAGRKELRAWLRSPEKKEYELLLKMCFGIEMEPGMLAEKLEAYAHKREGEIALMEQWLGELGDGQPYGPNTPYYRMITKLGLAYFKEEAEWCGESIETIKRLK
jgi:DNA-binding PadR family transcriptional regulator